MAYHNESRLTHQNGIWRACFLWGVEGTQYLVFEVWSALKKSPSVVFYFVLGGRETHFKDFLAFFGIFYRQFLWRFWVVCEKGPCILPNSRPYRKPPVGSCLMTSQDVHPWDVHDQRWRKQYRCHRCCCCLGDRGGGHVGCRSTIIEGDKEACCKRRLVDCLGDIVDTRNHQKDQKQLVWKNYFKENLWGVVLHCLRDGVGLFEGWCRWYLIWKKMI